MSKGKHSISSVIVLLLMSIFAACVLMVLLTGAASYKRLAFRDSKVYEWRTGIQYISAKIRQTDEIGAVWVDDFDEDTPIDTLFLSEIIGQQRYITRIYCYDGYLYELYAAEDAQMSVQDGTQIMQLKDMQLGQKDDRIAVSITDENDIQVRQMLTLRSKGGQKNEK